MTAASRRTSFFALTRAIEADSEIEVERVEIPLFQRDYAQGRDSDRVRRIRHEFLDAIRGSLVGDEPDSLGLDFVYGGIDGGTLRPLDGQQRLTTLFLVHWYLASRCGHLDQNHGWTRFSYATRQSARMFCESLIEHALPGGEVPSSWIVDQSWYLFLWRHDPTIQSMLVMLDDIDSNFRDVDVDVAWARLTSVEEPAVWFLLLPLSGLGSGSVEDMRPEDLYIKMNSRGKPLTEFENFKAHFEKTIQWSVRSGEFARKVDTAWSDLLWHLRGDDDLIDDEFLRYMEFITEICEWREGRHDGAGLQLGHRATIVFGESRHRETHLEFLIQALDVWVGRSIPEVFASKFVAGADRSDADVDKVRLFFRPDGSHQAVTDLFEECCRSYGRTRGRARVFSLGQTLMLYAVVIHFTERTDDFPLRVRVLRNLIEASADELRAERMPKILEDVHRLIRDGAIESVVTLNQAQVEDEKLKSAFLTVSPEFCPSLFRLEDHELLRGSLGAFELETAVFENRAKSFHLVMSQPDLWTDALGALLAVGEYQRQRSSGRAYLFGTDSKQHDSAWRDLLTGATRERLRLTREVLGGLLDRVAQAALPVAETLNLIMGEYLARCEAEQRFDWRYYMVRYPAMREKGSSTYFAERSVGSEHAEMGYSLCMLRAGGQALNGYYRDPYLLAIARESEKGGFVEDKWFVGYENEPRRLPLRQSGASIRCVFDGFELLPPTTDDTEAFGVACAELGANADGVVSVPQVVIDGRHIDTVDRIRLGVGIVDALVAAGL